MIDLQNASLVCLSNDSFANLKCDGSQGGLIGFLQGRNGKYVISLVVKKAKESSRKYLTCRNISVAGSHRSSYYDSKLCSLKF